MGQPEDEIRQSVTNFRELPEPIALEDTIASQQTEPPPDPTMGRDTEAEFVLRHAGG